MKTSMTALGFVVVFLLGNSVSTAQAGSDNCWVGRDTGNRQVHWSCRQGAGDDWTLTRNGASWGNYKVVERTKEYIELQAKGTRTFERIRIYANRITANEVGARFKWVDIATGKWRD